MNTDLCQLDRFVGGIAIIRKYVSDPYPLDAEHEIVYCGSYETSAQMTEEERALLESYGWFESYDSWAFFT